MISVAELPPDWRIYPPPAGLVLVGKRWLKQSRTAVLSVPSAVFPQERNFIINPNHVDFEMAHVGRPEAFSFDSRMRKRRS
jgi:RES domain-containing protein